MVEESLVAEKLLTGKNHVFSSFRNLLPDLSCLLYMKATNGWCQELMMIMTKMMMVVVVMMRMMMLMIMLMMMICFVDGVFG